jgi:hypothetical protein
MPGVRAAITRSAKLAAYDKDAKEKRDVLLLFRDDGCVT